MKPLESLNHGFESTTHINGTIGNNLNDFQGSKNKSYPFVYDFQINDLPEPVRNLLIKQVTIEEISCYSGTNIKVQGSLIPTDRKEIQSGSEPLHLHIQASKKQNIDRAVQRIKVQIQQAMNLPKYKEKVLIGLEMAPPVFDVRGKVLGTGGANLQYITNETSAIVTLRGRGSGFIEPTTGLESIEPLHLCVEHNKYDVLQAGRQLAFNLIETVQQEWYAYQQQNQQASSSSVNQHLSNQGVQVSSSNTNVGAASNSISVGADSSNMYGANNATTLVSLPPPPPPPSGTTVPTHTPTNIPPPNTTGIPPPLLSVPPPTHHAVSLPPPPASHTQTLQLATNLNQLVQGPPPQIQTALQTAPTTSMAQLSGGTQQAPVSAQAQQTVQPQQTSIQHQQILQQIGPAQATGIQPQQQQLLAQQTLQAHQLGILQTAGMQPQATLLQQPQHATLQQQSVLQQSQQSIGQPAAASSIQELSTHVYTTGAGGQVVAAPNILTQQVIPQTSIIAQQPQIIAQTSYPVQYMQGGQMVVYGTGGTVRGDATGGGLMLLQYQQPPNSSTQGLRTAPPPQIVRPIIQPQQIVQIVNPQTGQIQHVLGGFSGGGSAGSLLTGTGQVILPQPQIITPHQLQFTQIPQHQPIHILGSTSHQSVVPVSGTGQSVVVSQGGNISPHLLAVRPLQQVQPQKRKYEQDIQTFQLESSGNVTDGIVGSLVMKKERGVGDDSCGQRNSQEALQIQNNSTDSNKLISPSAQSDELNDRTSQQQQRETKSIFVNCDLLVDAKIPKRGRPSLSDSCTEVLDSRCDVKDKVIYSYSGGKPFSQLVSAQPQQVMCSIVQQPTQTHQTQQMPIQQYTGQTTNATQHTYQQPQSYYQQAPPGAIAGTITHGALTAAGGIQTGLTQTAALSSFPAYNSWGVGPPTNQQ